MFFRKLSTLFSLLFLLFSSLEAYPQNSQSIKEKKIYPMGKKIYEKKCQEIKPNIYKSYEELENFVKNENGCGSLNEKYAQALTLYLWDLKRVSNGRKIYAKLEVTKDEKCPVCGMFLYKYPRWITRINYEGKSLGFDGIKDMMKFYFEHQEGITEILVQDYYTQKTINAKEAFFVLGSDVYGPMGEELISFIDKRSAKRFSLDHRGKKVVKFSAIRVEDVYR